jgi:antitoxin VapB
MAARRAAVFRNGTNQAVRIPREFELDAREVLIHRDGDRLILTPVRDQRLEDLLATWTEVAEDWPEVEDLPPQERAAI